MGHPELPLLPYEPAVNGELNRAGLAFGDLVEHTGRSVASTQLRLDLNSAATAQALAETQVNVIAVRETTYDDVGVIDSQIDHMMRLPLINFVDPVFYEWSSVRLQGQYYAMEIATGSNASINNYTNQNNVSAGGVLIFAGGNISEGSTSSEIEVGRNSATDRSVGRMRMNAMLRPRKDVTVPKPIQVIRGPNIAILQSTFLPDMTGGFLSARTMELVIQFTRRDGNPIEGKMLSIETNGLTWVYTGSSSTDVEGNVSIVLTRSFVDAEADTTPADFIVSARKGMVSSSAAVQM